MHRRIVQIWNRVAERTPAWPQRQLALPSYRQAPRRTQIAAFVTSFQQDLESYLAMRANPDPFDHNQPAKALAPSTIKLRKQQLRLAASTLVEAGRDPTTITLLADLVTPEVFKSILRHGLSDHGGEANAWTEGVGKALIAAACEWIRPGDDRIAELKSLLRRLPKARPGMTAKNRNILRQLRDEATMARLLFLPERLFREAEQATPGDTAAAIKAQIAVAIDILLATGMRSKNLISLEVGRHVFVPTSKKHPIEIRLDAGETKNEAAALYELNGDAALRLRRYLSHFQPVLAPDGSPKLFVATGGRHKLQATLAKQIQEITRRRVGIALNPHIFRHLLGTLLDEAYPDSPELGRQMLGHKDIKTTRTYYSEGASRRAQQLCDTLFEERRRTLRFHAKRKRQRSAMPRSRAQAGTVPHSPRHISDKSNDDHEKGDNS